MIHHAINDSDHYSVGVSTTQRQVLVQLQRSGEQTRVPMSPTHARHCAALLIRAADEVDAEATTDAVGGLIGRHM